MHCLQRVKWKIGPVYIFLFLFGAFFIILPYTVLHSAAIHPLMYCLGWFHVEVRWASFMRHLACSILFSSFFLWDVRRLVLWIDFVEKGEGLMAMMKTEWFFFCSINEIFLPFAWVRTDSLYSYDQFHICCGILCFWRGQMWFLGMRLNRLGDSRQMQRWFCFCDGGDISDTVANEQWLYFHTQEDERLDGWRVVCGCVSWDGRSCEDILAGL